MRCVCALPRLAVLAALAGGDPREVAGAETLLASYGRLGGGSWGALEALVGGAVDEGGARRVLLGARAVAESLAAQQREAEGQQEEAGEQSGGWRASREVDAGWGQRVNSRCF